MSRIRFFSAQIYETGAPGKGPQFPAGFVLDADDVPTLLNVDNPSDDFAAAFLRRWVNRNAAEYVDDDVATSDLSNVVYINPAKPGSVVQPFGTANHGRPVDGIEAASHETGDDDGKEGPIDFSKLSRAELDALAGERGVDVTEAKNKADVIAALQAAEKPAE